MLVPVRASPGGNDFPEMTSFLFVRYIEEKFTRKLPSFQAVAVCVRICIRDDAVLRDAERLTVQQRGHRDD